MCKSGKELIFCTCKHQLPQVIPHKKSKRWQGKTNPPIDYVWTLSRFVEYTESMMEGLIMEPAEILGTELTNECVLQALEKPNCFDFDYIPNEGDSLSIRSNKYGDFLSFIYQNGTWITAQHNPFYVKIEKIETGKLRINDTETSN